MTQPHTAQNRPLWLPFANHILRRLIEAQDVGNLPELLGDDAATSTNALKSPPFDLLDDLPTTLHRPNEELAALQDAGIDGRALPASQSLMALRLAATFVSHQNVAGTILTPGSITVLTGFRSPEMDHILSAFRHGLLPEDWRPKTHASNHCVGDTLRIIQIDSNAFPPRNPAFQRFERTFIDALEQPHPLCVLLPQGQPFPANLASSLPAPIHLVPLDRQILMAHLEHSHRATGKIDHRIVESILPENEALSRISQPDLLLALRAPNPRTVAERLASKVSRAPRHGSSPLSLTLEDICGKSPAHRAAEALVADLISWQRGEINWHDMSHSLLLFGEPGTGKTVLARAIAASAEVPLIQGSFGEWQSRGHLGDMLAAMLDCFHDTRARKPCVLFIDEIDSAGSRNDRDAHGKNFRTQVINEFLRQIDGLDDGILLIGACNFPGAIDAAILRPGRFDLHREMPLPTVDQIQVMLEHAFPEATTGLRLLSRQFAGQTPAMIDAKIREARAAARREGQPFDPGSLGQSLDQERGNHSARDFRIAVHECGHAALATLCGEEVTRISLTPNGGITERFAPIHEGLETDYDRQLNIHLAGRAAERLVFRTVSAGAGGGENSDLAKAARLSLRLDREMGLGILGNAWVGPVHPTLLNATERRHLRERLDHAEGRARAMLAQHQPLLQDMAAALVVEREFDADVARFWLQGIARKPDPERDTADQMEEADRL